MTNAELAILSLIAEQPRHGYEIESVISERGMREWTEVGFSSIYYILKKLEKNGWVQSRLQQEGGRGPARRVHRITPTGSQAWHEAIVEALSCPHRCYTGFQLGLSCLPGIMTDESVAALRQYRARLAERRDHVCARWRRGGEPLSFHVNAMFDLSITMIEAELGWVEWFIGELERRSRGNSTEVASHGDENATSEDREA